MMTPAIEYQQTKEFNKDFKKLKKKFKTLTADLIAVKRNAIELFHLKKIDNQSIFLIPGFCSQDIKICKIKKIACKALKGRGSRSGLRIIYAFYPKQNLVILIEIYFKADKTNEDTKRIRQYISN
jgi:hypothetical protein